MKKITQNKASSEFKSIPENQLKNDQKLDPLKNDYKNTLNHILESGGEVYIPYVFPVMRPCNMITTVSVSVFLTGSIDRIYEYILDNIKRVYQGQCICLTERNLVPNVYLIKYINPNCSSINDITIEYVGEIMLTKGALYKREKINLGDLASYNGKDYIYTQAGWELFSPYDKSNINLDKITTPEDIIDAFDKLQERAKELGYPIKLFDKVSPIHPLHQSIDVELSLVYDDTTPNSILAAINVKQTVEKFWRDTNNAKS